MTGQENLSAGNWLSRDGFTICACSAMTKESFDRFYADVLRPAFPPEELIGIEELRTAYLDPGSGSLGMVAMLGGEPVGGMLGEYSERSGIMLLSYLAVRSDQRSTGLGGSLIRTVLPLWRESFALSAILAEIEDPRYFTSSSHGDPAARIRFYERIGAKLLPLSYFQPSLGPGLERVRGMFLICLDPEREYVPGQAVLEFMDEYMESSENAVPLSPDPEYRAFRDQVSAWQGRVPLWPMSRAGEAPESAFATPVHRG